MLAIIRAFEEWRAELQSYETKIEVYTDHKALEHFMSTKEVPSLSLRFGLR
jgi:hypothetical protein